MIEANEIDGIGKMGKFPILFVSFVASSVIFVLFKLFKSSRLTTRHVNTPPIRTLSDGALLQGPFKELGGGAFGKVYEYSLDSIKVAVKIPEKPEYNSLQEREFEISNKAGPHGNIVRLYRKEMIDQKVFIIMELMAGTLRQLLENFPQLSLKTRLSLGIQITKAMVRLHNYNGAQVNVHGIIHQDLKSDNVLLDKLEDNPNVTAKVADLGIALAQHRTRLPLLGTITKEKLFEGLGGTLIYMAPEVIAAMISNSGGGNTKSDIFSLGLVLCELETSHRPQRSRDEIIKGEFNEFAQHKDKYRFFGSVIEGCIKPNPSQRLTAPDVLTKLEAIKKTKFG